MAADAIDVALLVAAAIDRSGGQYFVGGSVASSLQGEPRSTNDIDFVVAVSRIRVFVEALGADFEVDEIMLRTELAQAGSANIFYLPWVTKVDLFAVGDSPYDQIEFARRRRIRVRGAGDELWIKAPEDTVLRKLLWFREGGEVSEKQWRDILGVLRISGPQLDAAYLHDWANRLGLASLLERALDATS